MSGGSFDYLSSRNDLENRKDEIERMREEPENRGLMDASQATKQILDEIKKLEDAREALLQKVEPLRDLWHSVEYHVNCDYGPEEVERSYQNWKKKMEKSDA
jgi:hypothetical protein